MVRKKIWRPGHQFENHCSNNAMVLLFREKARNAPDLGELLELVEINLCVTLMEKEWKILVLDQRQSENAYQV